MNLYRKGKPIRWLLLSCGKNSKSKGGERYRLQYLMIAEFGQAHMMWMQKISEM